MRFFCLAQPDNGNEHGWDDGRCNGENPTLQGVIHNGLILAVDTLRRAVRKKVRFPTDVNCLEPVLPHRRRFVARKPSLSIFAIDQPFIERGLLAPPADAKGYVMGTSPGNTRRHHWNSGSQHP